MSEAVRARYRWSIRPSLAGETIMRDDVRQEGIYGVIRRQGIALQSLADACRSDKDRLREVEERPKDVRREHGIDMPMGVSVVLNTRHLAMPPDPNQAAVADGGKTMATSAGTLPSCASAAGSMNGFATASI